MFSREIVGNVESPGNPISRRLLFFAKFSSENGPYRMGSGNKYKDDQFHSMG